MKLSISHLAWGEEYDSQLYARLPEYGFSGLEIAPTRIFPVNPYQHLQEIQIFRQKLAQEYKLSIPSMQSIWFGRQEKLFADANQRQILLEYSQAAVQFAQAAGCHNLVFGSPRSRRMYHDSDYHVGLQFFSELAEYAAAHDTVIGLEANPEIYDTNYITTTQQAIRLIQEVKHPALRLNLDLGTMLVNDENASILSGFVHLIQHVHISEPYLKPIVPHSLHREVIRLLKEEGYQGYISIEMGRQSDIASVLDAMQYVREAVEFAIS